MAERLSTRPDIERSKVRILGEIFVYSLSFSGILFAFLFGNSMCACLFACFLLMTTVNRRGRYYF